MSRPVRLAAALVAAAALVPAAASAAPAPFGHACAPQDGVRFCPASDPATRPLSFDGTPLDVDVTLPASGDGPFPTILLLHGLGGNKTSFEGTSGGETAIYSNWAFAREGYAVVTPTARGFAGSGGTTYLGDMRYEVRDIQTLVGQLVDEGVVDPRAIGSTGISYGGGFSTMLAFLKDRVRLPDGGYAPWTSPKGTPIALSAAWPRWLWSDGPSIFTRNGRGPWARTPIGVEAQAYANGIFGVAFSGTLAPAGGDLSTDLRKWKSQLDAGRYGPDTQPTFDNTYNYHGVTGVPGTPAPLLLQSGWTDALFPVAQSLGAYDHIRAQSKSAAVALQLGDLGHAPGANHPRDVLAFDRAGQAFLAAWVKGDASARRPAPGAVTAFLTRCPPSAPAGGGPVTAASYDRLARRTLRFGTTRSLAITSKGGSAKLAAALAPTSPTGNHCATFAPDTTNKAVFSTVSKGVTLVGRTVLTGRVTTTGRYGQLDARVWDRDPRTGRQRLVDRGAYRLTPDQKGRFRFILDGNGWRFAKGHRIVVEVLGRDAPTYGASPAAFHAVVTDAKAQLPVR